MLADTEKTYSGLGEACAKAGKAGCKLIEITGDGASGDAVKTLLNDAHDVTDSPPGPSNPTDFALSQVALELYRSGYLELPAGVLKSAVADFCLPKAPHLTRQQFTCLIFCTIHRRGASP